MVSPGLAWSSAAAQEFRAIWFGPSGGKGFPAADRNGPSGGRSAKSMAVIVE